MGERACNEKCPLIGDCEDKESMQEKQEAEKIVQVVAYDIAKHGLVYRAVKQALEN